MASKRKTKDVLYKVETCCGDPLAEVSLRLPLDAEPMLFRWKAIEKAGFRQHVCGSCYDDAYHAQEQGQD